ncbi:MAG TPA: ABC-type transport auxiliary lipoprotein family protein [Methyloceanibacter sp.]|jgi:phospholipid/cholesterol/gamma-HCH transport system substrate-binding protein
METRARYALIGLFLLAVIAAGFGFVYWLENKGGFAQREVYQIKFQGSVSGLLVGSAVLFNGIRVGEVTGLGLNPDAPQDVIATIAVDRGTPVRTDTQVGIETQGLTGGAAVSLRGGSSSAPLATTEGGAPPTLIAAPQAGQDWTQAARDAFQRVDQILKENSEALNSAITNIDTFSDALARNSDKVDGILVGLERMTGGGTSQAEIPIYDLVAATNFPSQPEVAPSWLLVVPEPTTLMGFNTDKILLQPAEGESVPLVNARWGDNLPVLFQAKVIQSFENAGYAKSVSRTRDGVTGDYQLLIDIRRFHISTASESAAEIEFVAKILDRDGKIVNASTFQGNAPVKGTDAQAYVSAFDEVFTKLMSELLEWTTGVLDKVPLPPVTVAPPSAPDQPMP